MSQPERSLSQLSRLRGRERFITLVWGVVRVVCVIAFFLALACLIDRWIDMSRETPFGVRVLMAVLQLLIAAGVIYFWVLRPLVQGIHDDVLAQRVEREIPEYGHRLVTSIQLTRETAQTGGMSRELISMLTREAEDLSDQHDLRRLADTSRLTWSLGLTVVLLGIAFVFLLFLKFDFNLARILVKRQLLTNDEIPHFINLANETDPLWPAGDEVTVQYRVRFKNYVEEQKIGTVRIVPSGMPAEEYPLIFAEKIDAETALFTAKIPPTTLNFTHRAWLGDGRTRSESQVNFEPRPVVTQISAWVQLPDYVGKKADGTPYETLMNQGEVLGLTGSQVRLRIRVQKPISQAKLILVGRGKNIGTEKDLPPREMQLLSEVDEKGEVLVGAEASFKLESNLLAYKIEVKDQFGFASASPTRRGIALAPDDPPHVALLPERFAAPGEAATDDTEVEGMPVPLGKNIRIAYTAQSPLGLRRARLGYKINEGDWSFLTLKSVKETEETGPFDPRKGAFAKSGVTDEVEFATLPSLDPNEKPPDLEGGGRFDFKTRALKKKGMDGKETELEVGDRVEFYVEVFDKNEAKGREPGKSEARIKGIVTDSQFIDWIVQTLQSESRLKQLEEKQKGVFRKPGL